MLITQLSVFVASSVSSILCFSSHTHNTPPRVFLNTYCPFPYIHHPFVLNLPFPPHLSHTALFVCAYLWIHAIFQKHRDYSIIFVLLHFCVESVNVFFVVLFAIVCHFFFSPFHYSTLHHSSFSSSPAASCFSKWFSQINSAIATLRFIDCRYHIIPCQWPQVTN